MGNNMAKKLFLVAMITLILPITLSAAVVTDTLYLKGTVGLRNFLDVVQSAGVSVEEAVALDSGPVLLESPEIGAVVGTWSVSSNSNATLNLLVEYGPFATTINDVVVQIPYKINNGTSQINSGGIFKALQRVNGIYPAEQNSGSIFIKRIDDNPYPPSSSYLTTITFILATE